MQLFKKDSMEAEPPLAKPTSAPARRALSAQKLARAVLPDISRPERNKSAPADRK